MTLPQWLFVAGVCVMFGMMIIAGIYDGYERRGGK